MNIRSMASKDHNYQQSLGERTKILKQKPKLKLKLKLKLKKKKTKEKLTMREGKSRNGS